MLRKFSGSDIHSIMMEADQIDLIPLARSAQPKRYFSIFFLPLVVDVSIVSDGKYFTELPSPPRTGGGRGRRVVGGEA